MNSVQRIHIWIDLVLLFPYVQFSSAELPELPDRSICGLPTAHGSCSGSADMYHFNIHTRTCETFSYSGCGGNNNRFWSSLECRRNCLQEDVCKLPSERGPCQKNIELFYHNNTEKDCKSFTYGGCGGNANRFITYKVCRDNCYKEPPKKQKIQKPAPVPDWSICGLKPDEGSCNSHVEMFYFDYKAQMCRSFFYKGCEGNRNRFTTGDECRENCYQPTVCQLPKLPGPCTDKLDLFYYNPRTLDCEPFVYGGCDGNANRFWTYKSCLQNCQTELGRSPNKTDVCYLPAERGECKGTDILYYYNHWRQKCLPFTWGGCGGTKNRFLDTDECDSRCTNAIKFQAAKRPELNYICKLPMDKGVCNDTVYVYYHDLKTRQCTRFTYTGCGGNANRFSTVMECLEKCPKTTEAIRESGSAHLASGIATLIVVGVATIVM